MTFRVLTKTPKPPVPPYDPDSHEIYHCAGHLPHPGSYPVDAIIKCDGCGCYWLRDTVYAPWGPQRHRDGDPSWHTCSDPAAYGYQV